MGTHKAPRSLPNNDIQTPIEVVISAVSTLEGHGTLHTLLFHTYERNLHLNFKLRCRYTALHLPRCRSPYPSRSSNELSMET
eukprot:3115853-Amphidinium_carterae.1